MKHTHITSRMFVASLFVASFLFGGVPAHAMDSWDTVTPVGASGQTFRTIVSAGDTVLLGTSANVHRSANGGASWSAGSGLSGSVNAIAIGWVVGGLGYEVTDPTPMYAGTDAGVYESTLGSDIWTPTALTGVAVNDIEVDQFLAVQGVASTLYAGTVGGVYRSDDAGVTWVLVNTGMEGLAVKSIVTDFALGNIYALTTGNVLYVSPLFSMSGADESWSQVYAGGTVNDVSLLNGIGGITWLSTASGIMKDDGTLSWTSKNLGLSAGNIRAVASDYLDPNIAYAIHASAGVFRTTNEALESAPDAQWLPINKGLSALSLVDIASNPVNPLLVHTISGSGVYRMELSDTYVDLTPPGTITNLSVSASDAETATLAWTRPGDDGAYGTPTLYDVRFSTSPIVTETDWQNATEADAEPTPYVGWTTAEVFMVQPLQANTKHYFAVKAVDDGGNFSALSNVVSAGTTGPAPDTVAPVVNLFTIASTSPSLTVPVVILSATDDVEVAGYKITESATAPLASASGWTTDAPTSFTFTSAGVKTLRAWAKDTAGNVSTPATDATMITIAVVDTTAPIITSFTIPTTATSLNVPISTFTITNTGTTWHIVSEDGTTPLVDDLGWNTVKPTTFIFANPGINTLYAWTKDSAGNISARASDTITITIPDTTAPTVSITSPDHNASVSGAVTVTAHAHDLVGVVGVQFKLDGANLGGEDTSEPFATPWNTTSSGNGTHTLVAVARDAVGNRATSSAIFATVNNTVLDTTAPTVSVTAPANNATVSGTVSVTASASDTVGVVGVQFKLDGVNLGTEDTTNPYSTSWNTTTATNGAHTLVAVARDSAGNRATSTVVNVTVNNVAPDTQKPIISLFVMPATSSALTVSVTTFTATDNTAVTGYLITESATAPLAGVGGWTATAPTSFTFASAGARTAYAWAKDTAGNVSASSSRAVTITLPVVTDTTAPSVPTALSVSNVSAMSLALSWGTSTDAVGVTGYRIMRGVTSGSLVQVGTSTSATFTDGALSALTTYFYAVRAFDGAGNVSGASTQVSTTTLPSIPAGFTGTANSTSQITLSWNAPTEAIVGFELYRAGTLIATTSTSTLTYADTGLSSGTAYAYTLRTYTNTGVRSLFTPSLSVTTQSPAPAPVSSGGGGGGGGGGTAFYYGCMDKTATNYSAIANMSNNSCVYPNGTVGTGTTTATTTGTVAGVSTTAVSLPSTQTLTLPPLLRDLKLGMEGADVKVLQTLLAQDKSVYPEGNTSGFFGPLTMKAVIKFQEKYRAELLTPNGLTAGTGFVGPSTRKKLNTFLGIATTPTTVSTPIATTPVVGVALTRDLKLGMKGDDVKALQAFLAKDKSIYPDGTASGFFGPLTMNAVIKFQEKHRAELLTPNGLTAGTGFVGPSTRKKLNALLGN